MPVARDVRHALARQAGSGWRQTDDRHDRAGASVSRGVGEHIIEARDFQIIGQDQISERSSGVSVRCARKQLIDLTGVELARCCQKIARERQVDGRGSDRRHQDTTQLADQALDEVGILERRMKVDHHLVRRGEPVVGPPQRHRR